VECKCNTWLGKHLKGTLNITHRLGSPDIDMQRIRRYFPILALLTMFLLGTWMSHTAVAMPLGISSAAMPSVLMSEMSCCRGDHGMDMSAHTCRMSGQCMSICAEAHAPKGPRLPGVSVPAPIMIGSVTFLSLVKIPPDSRPVFYSHPSHHHPPLQHMRLVI
jgi:hypothetical protein